MWLIKVMGDRMPTDAGSDHEVAHKDGGEGHRALGEGSGFGQTVCVLVPGMATVSVNVAEGGATGVAEHTVSKAVNNGEDEFDNVDVGLEDARTVDGVD